MVGQFCDGVGEFTGVDTYKDVPIIARFRWSGITSDAARWEQAFSTDEGKTWMDNWYMDLTRRD